jgi:hypothetical protein
MRSNLGERKTTGSITNINEDDAWETVIDFTKIEKGGVLAQVIIATLENMETNERRSSLPITNY